jgi:NAD(P)-dependent dehydrogenase (short-subunit alcohol dehydrogenase family)
MFDFTDQVVLVTGGSGNLGSAAVRAFWAAGAQLIVPDRSVGRLAGQFPALAQSGDHFLADGVDVTQPADMAALVEEIKRRFGRLDVLANTVGGYKAGAPVHLTPLDVWSDMLNLNARSVFVTSQAVIPLMLAQGSGRIIHTSARAALAGGANAAAYSASKSAVVRLVESMAAELKDAGITVNCILPGTIDTPDNRQASPSADFSRWVAPQAIADVILFLASSAARAVSGAAIPVYGRS